jgi:predicted secreted acid phosphatase
MIVFCDLDGTVANNSHRTGFIQSTKKDWDTFYSPELILKDEPIPEALRVLERMSGQPGLLVYFLTGRPEKTRQATIEWLRTHLKWNVSALPALLYKEEHIQKVHSVFPNKVKFFIDDDVRNEAMYRRLGILMKAPGCWEHIV